MNRILQLGLYLGVLGLVACSVTTPSEIQDETGPESTAVSDSAFVSPVEESSPAPTPTSGNGAEVTPEATYEIVLEEFNTLAGYILLDGKKIYYITTPVYGSLDLTGLAADDQENWIVNNDSNSIFSVNAVTGEIAQTFSFPTDLGPDPSISGLTWDGENFWIADSQSQTIAQYDAQFETRLKSFTVNAPPGDIAWDGSAVWVVSREDIELQKWSPAGELLEAQAVPGNWITGLAWGADRLWYADTGEKSVSVWDPATSSGNVILVDALADTSFGGLGWRNNSLLLLDDAGGRLLSFDVQEFEFVK